MKNSILQQRLWRWHFWAGLLSLPLALVLAISGSIYLFKPHYEQWFEQQLERDLPSAHIPAINNDQLLRTLRRQYPDAHLKQFTLPRTDDRSVEFELVLNGQTHKFWIDRFSGERLHSQPTQQQLMQWIKRLHGELTLGNNGSYVVELMAQWMIVLIVTGLALYLSRQKAAAHGNWAQALQRSFFPALQIGTKLFWRRLHAALGIWLSVFLLLFLISGLPWTQVWGGGFKHLQNLMGWDGPGQEWNVTLQSQTPEIPADDLWSLGSEDELIEPLPAAPLHGITLDQIVTIVVPMQLPPPVIVQPPRGHNGVWTVRAMTPNRPDRVTLHFDRWNGNLIRQITFDDYHPVKRVVSYGIALHEGALFGWPNLLLALFTALGLVGIVISGFKMWWQRKPQGKIGVPPLLPGQVPRTLWYVAILLGITLPLFAASALLVVLLDRVGHFFCQRMRSSESTVETD